MKPSQSQGSHFGGSSGATITVTSLPPAAVKSSMQHDVALRIVAQGNWLHFNASPALPLVRDIFENGYEMEKLTPLPSSKILDGNALMRQATKLMHEHVWSRPPMVRFDWSAHMLKMHPLIDEYIGDESWRIAVLEAGAKLKWDKLTKRLSHGDPTYDNMMLRSPNELVITDPIPATHAVPDLLCVDIGKMLQSVHGFEDARYEDPHRNLKCTPQPLLDYLISNTEDSQAEWAAARYWHVVHLLRAMPYVPKETRGALFIQLATALRRL